MKCFWTRHAEHRQKEWEKILGITVKQVENVVLNPQQIVEGDLDIRIAQSKRGNGLIRVPFIQVEDNRKILTVYWTSKINKYWR